MMSFPASGLFQDTHIFCQPALALAAVVLLDPVKFQKALRLRSYVKPGVQVKMALGVWK